ncbi:MAG: DNA alkylation repair protein, partial [Dyadobacter sp.]
MSAIKDIYSPAFYNQFADILKQAVPDFDKNAFINQIFVEEFKAMEWKERMKHTTRVFHVFLPEDYPKATTLIEKIITILRKENIGGGLEYIFFADYVEVYGLDDFKTSVKALEFITQFISCEFGVRPFILKYGDKMIDQMVIWSKHENLHVRRFASEGSRPRLPWAMAIPALKKDPSPLFPILENLKNDPSEYVRRSVANNLNDIAKDHPDVVLSIAKRWRGGSKETDAIIKHGSRTLLKQGHAEILEVYGLDGKS